MVKGVVVVMFLQNDGFFPACRSSFIIVLLGEMSSNFEFLFSQYLRCCNQRIGGT